MPLALLDTNVLVHAAYVGAKHHRAAAILVDHGLRESGRFCIAPQNLIEFAAVISRSTLVNPPMPSDAVVRMTGLLYRSRRLAKIYPQRGTVIRAIREGIALNIKGPIWYDMFLAMTMRDADVRIIVTDNIRDFEKFPFLAAKSIEDMSQ